ncbi:MAG: AlpA family phage regulatory protein [Bacilli bacterium]
MKDVCRILNASRNTVYAIHQRDPSFPTAIKFGDKKQARVYYRESEIKDWVLNLSSSDSQMESEK